MREKISESSGKLKSKAYIEEAPSGLSDAFAGGDISTNVIDKFITAHGKLVDKVSDINDKINEFNNEASNLAEKLKTDPHTVRPAGDTSKEPKGPIETAIKMLRNNKNQDHEYVFEGLIGGLKITYKFEEDDDGNVTLDITREYGDKKDKSGVVLAEKSDVKNILTNTLTLINNNIKAKAKQEKLQESFNKLSIAVEKAINNFEIKNNNNKDEAATEAEQKRLRKLMKAVYKINAKAPSIQTEFLNLNVKLAKAVISYAALCLKNYK